MTGPAHTQKIRQPAVAGTFYPGDAAVLAAQVEDCLAAARDVPARPPKALIAPHAGYVYSGPIAGTAYAPFRGAAGEKIRRVVLMGPSHRVAFRGLAVPHADAFASPLGTVPVDKAAVAKILSLPGVGVFDAAHAEEHSLEVHLPFLQRLVPNFALVPLVVGDAEPEDVDRVLAALWGGPETLVVVSSDLSHYYDYDTARGLDADASRAIEMLRPDLLREEQACGRHPVRGLLRRARGLDLRATAVDLRNSGDTAGDRTRVVGYGAYVFEDAAGARLPDAERRALKAAAVQSIAHGVKTGGTPKIDVAGFTRSLQAMRATFVTVMLDGRLRGCIGTLEPHLSLIEDVVQNACKAALSDPRFPPVTMAEAGRLEIGVSILSHPRPIAFEGEAGLLAALRPGVDGVVLSAGERRGLFLPQVWENLPEPADFVGHLKEKTGLARDRWSPDIHAKRFTVESF